jgi:hypothetical protein
MLKLPPRTFIASFFDFGIDTNFAISNILIFHLPMMARYPCDGVP